jgi:hypothetical protein
MASTLCAGKDNSRPSRGCVARDLLASVFRQSGVQRVKVPCCPISRNPEPRKHRRRSKPGPQYHEAISTVCPRETPGARLGSPPFRPSRFRSARSSSLISPMREATRASRTWGPQHHRVSSEPSDLGGCTSPTQAISAFHSSRFQGTGISPFLFTNAESTVESKHRVTARGHLGNKKSCVRGAKGTEFSYRGDHRDLQVPSDLISILFLVWS